MKTLAFTLSFLLITLCTNSYAQLKQKVDSIIKVNNEGVQVARSYYSHDKNGYQTMSMHYTLNKKTNIWVGTFKETALYDDNGNCLNKVTSFWDMRKHNWIEMSRETSKYDEYGRQIEYDSRQWNVDRACWIGLEKKSFAFSDMGLIATYQEYLWNETKGDWGNLIIDEYEYNTEGQKTVEMHSKWRNNEWNRTSRTEYKYDDVTHAPICEVLFHDENGQWVPESETTYLYKEATETENATKTKHLRLYNKESKQWVDIEEYISTLDAKGTEIAIKRREFKNNQWYITKDDRNTTRYDEHGNETFNEKSQWIGGDEWEGRSRNETQYNEYGDVAMERETRWDLSTNDWKGMKFIEYEYDTDGYVIKEKHYRWDTKTNDWKNMSRMEYEYDENHNKTKESTSSWNSVKQRWEVFYNGKFEYTFDKEGYIAIIKESMTDPNGKWKDVSTTYYY